MLNEILFALWFFLPAGLANAVPVIVMKLPILKKWNYPMDFYLKIKGVRIFGDHKSIRGLISGVLVGILAAGVQVWIYGQSEWIRSVIDLDYSKLNFWLLGGLLGFGAIMGDAIKSFFKRRVNIKPGGTWFPFDQLDYIFGGVLFVCPYVQLSLLRFVLIVGIWFLLHILTTIFGYAVKLKDSPI